MSHLCIVALSVQGFQFLWFALYFYYYYHYFLFGVFVLGDQFLRVPGNLVRSSLVISNLDVVVLNC